MEMKDNFDDIIRRRWEERQFPVDAQHRADMARLLDDRKRRRGFPIWWMAGLVGLAGTLILLMTITRSGSEASSFQEGISNESATPSAPSTPATPSTPSHVADRSSQVQSENVETGNASLAREPRASLTPGAGVGGSNNESKNQPQVSNKVNTPVRSEDQPANMIHPKRDVTVTSMPEGGLFPGTLSPIPSISEQKAIPVVTEDEDIFATTPDVEQTTRDANRVPSVKPLDMNGLDLDQDHSIPQPGPVSPHRTKVYLLAEAGGDMVFGAEPQYAPGWKIRAGGGLGLTISPRVNLFWTAGYMMQQGGFDFERSSTVRQAGFGARSSFNTLSPDRMHHVYSRLGMNYRIRRHVIHGFAGAEWLYGMQGHISVYTQDQLTGQEQSSDYAWLQTDGLHRMRIMTGIGYGFQLTPRIMALAGAQAYLTPLTRRDPVLQQEGYDWNGHSAAIHPFITFNYILYARR